TGQRGYDAVDSPGEAHGVFSRREQRTSRPPEEALAVIVLLSTGASTSTAAATAAASRSGRRSKVGSRSGDGGRSPQVPGDAMHAASREPVEAADHLAGCVADGDDD